MPKTSSSSSTHRSSSTSTPPTDINGRSIEQLVRPPAEVLRLHLTSRHLVTSGPKATMAKRLYDAVNPFTINNGDDVSCSQELGVTAVGAPWAIGGGGCTLKVTAAYA